MEEHSDQTPTSAAATTAPSSPTRPISPLMEEEASIKHYVDSDVIFKHVLRQSVILSKSLESKLEVPLQICELSKAYEKELFSPRVPPRKLENGTCEPNPSLNFYPTFMLPETLATYHIFFQNQKIPLSCRANRPKADEELLMRSGDSLPDYPTTDRVPKIFEGLGDEELASAKALEESADSSLPELKTDNPRLAVMKRSVALTHCAYPAINLPPKVMTCIMEKLIISKAKPVTDESPGEEGGQPVVSDVELARWLGVKPDDTATLEARRKSMLASTLVTLQLECMRRFFTSDEMIKKLSESLHYMFNHGYVKLGSKISNVELTNLISYMGILHENRLGQNVLHNTLKGEARRDYVRDCIYLYLVYTWQTAMGVWQQCLESENVKELGKILNRKRRELWSGFDERTIASDLADIVFPAKLVETLCNSLPDFTSQSQMQNFRSFILERSGILPAVCNAMPSDFVPIKYKECPPTLWHYCYLLNLANYLMFHSDIAYDNTGEGLLECYCRCNLCSPHRCLVTNTPLLNEVQAINTFEMQPPPKPDGTLPPPFKLSAGLWTSAFLRHFEREDFHAKTIQFYEDQNKPPKVTPNACVITQGEILAQLQEIKKAREQFLLKKGHGVYLDPQTGEELNSAAATPSHNVYREQRRQKGRQPQKEEDASSSSTLSRPNRRSRGGRMVRGDIGQRGGRGVRFGGDSMQEAEEEGH